MDGAGCAGPVRRVFAVGVVEIAGELELKLRRHLFFSFSLFLFGAAGLPGSLRGQTSVPVISRISLAVHGAYDSTDANLLTKILSFFHVTTKEQFIRKEIPFRAGEPFDSARVAEAERNLRALGVFKSVSVTTTRIGDSVAVLITTRDLITAQLVESFSNSGGSITWGVKLVEANLLGTLSAAEVGYRHDPDRNTFDVAVARRRLFNNKINGAIGVFDRSDGTLFYAQLTQPYFEASSRTSGALYFDDRSARILQYRNGKTDTAFAAVQNRYLLTRVDYGHALRANSAGYFRLGAAAQVRRDDYIADSLYQLGGFPVSSVTGAFGVYAEVSRVNKPKIFAFQSMSSEEDVDLSTTARFSLFVAPALLGYQPGHAGFAPGVGLHTGFKFPGGFVFADAFATGLYTSNGLDSGQVYAGATAVITPGRRHQLLLHGDIAALKNPLPGTEFDLGLGTGPRAYHLHSFTGDREYIATAEYRFTLGRDLFKAADIGLAAFFDLGGAWWAGDTRRSGWDAGVGVRSAFGHGTGLGVNRLDLAWRGSRPDLPGGWVVAVGRGFVFSTSPRGTSR